MSSKTTNSEASSEPGYRCDCGATLSTSKPSAVRRHEGTKGHQRWSEESIQKTAPVVPETITPVETEEPPQGFQSVSTGKVAKIRGSGFDVGERDFNIMDLDQQPQKPTPSRERPKRRPISVVQQELDQTEGIARRLKRLQRLAEKDSDYQDMLDETREEALQLPIVQTYRRLQDQNDPEALDKAISSRLEALRREASKASNIPTDRAARKIYALKREAKKSDDIDKRIAALKKEISDIQSSVLTWLSPDETIRHRGDAWKLQKKKRELEKQVRRLREDLHATIVVATERKAKGSQVIQWLTTTPQWNVDQTFKDVVLGEDFNRVDELKELDAELERMVRAAQKAMEEARKRREAREAAMKRLEQKQQSIKEVVSKKEAIAAYCPEATCSNAGYAGNICRRHRRRMIPVAPRYQQKKHVGSNKLKPQPKSISEIARREMEFGKNNMAIDTGVSEEEWDDLLGEF